MPYVWLVRPGLPPLEPPIYHVSSNLLTHSQQLVIPKYHGEKLADIPDEHLTELLVCVTHPSSCSRFYGLSKLTTRTQPVAKKIAIASGAKDYNILQNNGKIAHQEVGHVSPFPDKP